MRVLLSIAALITVVFRQGHAAAQPIDHEAWREDYRALRSFISTDYANLDWAVETRDLDPVALNHDTLAAIDAAQNDDDARAALQAFVDAFNDGHLRLADPAGHDGEESATPTIAASLPAAEACTQLGFGPGHLRRWAFGLDGPVSLPEGAEFTADRNEDNAYAAGTLTVDGVAYGYVRIGIFVTEWHERTCQTVWEARQNETNEPCDENCQEDLFSVGIPNALIDDFDQRLAAFHSAGIDRLIVDVTGNGGGYGWADALARMVGGRKLACPVQQLPRTDFWEAEFTASIARIEADLAATTDAQTRVLLEDARATYQALAAQTADRCEAAEALWTEASRQRCVRNTTHPYNSCGALGRPADIPLTTLESGEDLFRPSVFALPEVRTFEDTVVLMDRGTASATEIFAAMIADADAAVLIGARSFGVGCGYINGGSNLTLPNSRLTVRAPNCQRQRANGQNEADGIAPDIALDWGRGVSAEDRLSQLIDTLRTRQAR